MTDTATKVDPATRKRGGDPDVKGKPQAQPDKPAEERALEEALEESMVGSDPVSVIQPGRNFIRGRE